MQEAAKGMFARLVQALESTSGLVDQKFDEAISVLAKSNAPLVVTGLGKSGLIAQKVAATMSSTGTRSVFVHPVEAMHGDLGIIEENANMLALSKSGNNAETIDFARQFKTLSNGTVISISEPNSRLSEVSSIALSIPALPELDEFDLAPTTSSVTTLALCDVLATCVQRAKGFTDRDFARFHPSGTLGRRLLLKVQDLMIQSDALPQTSTGDSFSDVLHEISSKGLGLTLLVDSDHEYLGVLTDGDIRRLLERQEPVMQMSAEQCFHASRRTDDLPSVAHGTADPETMAIDCLENMQAEQITSIAVLKNRKVHGLIRMQELVQAGLT